MSSPNALLSKWYGTGEVKEAAPAPTDAEKQAAANIAEADFLGRVVAHSYVDEMKKLAAAAEAPAEQEIPPELSAAAEKVAMDILHESGVNPFTFKDYQDEAEKTATAQWWDEQVKEAQGEAPAINPLRAARAGEAKEAAAEPSDEVKQAVLYLAWEKLAQHGFTPAQAA